MSLLHKQNSDLLYDFHIEFKTPVQPNKRQKTSPNGLKGNGDGKPVSASGESTRPKVEPTNLGDETASQSVKAASQNDEGTKTRSRQNRGVRSKKDQGCQIILLKKYYTFF